MLKNLSILMLIGSRPVLGSVKKKIKTVPKITAISHCDANDAVAG